MSQLPAGSFASEVSPAPVIPRDTLCLWMRQMEEYGQVWHEDIGRDFFSQEYWYLLVIAMVHYWRRVPLNIGDACNSMKTGSAKTRENRLRKLLESYWFQKSKSTADKRQTCVTPTPEMLRIVGAHLRNSLARVARFTQRRAMFQGDLQQLLPRLEKPGDDLDKHCLLP